MTGIIYALLDPDTGAVRYVGQTKNWRKRYAEHCRLSNNQSATHRAKWLASLLSTGKRPHGQVLEEASDLDAAEIRWIAHYRALGCDLVNGNAGGKDLSHAHKKKRQSEYQGKQTPLQRIQLEIGQTVRFLRRIGHPARADSVEQKLKTVREKIAFVRKTFGKEGIADMNRRLSHVET